MENPKIQSVNPKQTQNSNFEFSLSPVMEKELPGTTAGLI